MAKQSFLMYCDYRQHFLLLSKEQQSDLLMFIFDYVETREAPNIDDKLVAMAFSFIKSNLDRDFDKYDKICNRNRNNGLRGGRPKNPVGYPETQGNPEKPRETQRNPEKPKKADTDTDIENDTDKKKKKKVYKKKKFTPPTLEEVKKYCKSRNNNVNPKRFFDFYETADWFDSEGKKVANWKQKVITWEGNDNSRRPTRSSTKPWVGEDYASKIHI